jgi:hypothetical protein
VKHDVRGDALKLHLWPKQWTAFLSTATEILFGGAAGPGKSYLMRIAAILWCTSIPGLQVYLFRRVREDLYKNHMEGPKGFRGLLGIWVLAGWCKIAGDEIRFWNSSVIYLCHCKDEKDIYKYQGAEIHVLLIDELTHFTESMYRFLRNRVRMVGIVLPLKYIGQFPRILCGANPGNIGHLWVKMTFISPCVPMEIRTMPPSEGGMRRQFIPGRLEDNPSMAADDPGYEMRLEGLGSKSLVAAMRYGDWDVIEGAFFDCWDQKRHVIRPFEIPMDWIRFRSGDWGSASPFSFGWWAIVGDTWRTQDRQILPRGCLVRYREWYGMQPGKANVGLKMHAEKVGEGLVERDALDAQIINGKPQQAKISYGVLDPSAFKEDGGPSIAERIYKGSGNKILFRHADNARVPGRGAMGGWDQVRARFVGDGDGNAMIGCFSTCLDSIRTIPALQHDPKRLEDVQTDGEDHAGDDWRYACMSRPWNRETQVIPPMRGTLEMTMNEAYALASPKLDRERI